MSWIGSKPSIKPIHHTWSFVEQTISPWEDTQTDIISIKLNPLWCQIGKWNSNPKGYITKRKEGNDLIPRFNVEVNWKWRTTQIRSPLWKLGSKVESGTQTPIPLKSLEYVKPKANYILPEIFMKQEEK